MQNMIGLAIESLVAVLLVATIAYCAVLNRRLGRLRADEDVMRATITELVSATHAAERGVVALRATLGHCEETLAERLGRAQEMSNAIAGQLGEGEQVIDRISKIARAARDHAVQEQVRAEVDRRDAEREAARIAARLGAEREADLRAEAARAPAGRSAATAAAAEQLTSRLRALGAGAPA